MNLRRFAGLIVLGSQAAHAEVTERLAYSYYIAKAQADTPIAVTLNQASPIHENGHTFHADTKWYVNWKFRWTESADGSCRMNRVDVDVDSRIKLPSLTNATEQQDRQFHTYLFALQAHELGHVSFGKQAALDIERAILNLPGMGNCTALENAANRLGNQILDDYRAREVQYDATTGHGRTQGARLE